MTERRTGLEGLTALITGASRGLGAVIAERLAADGATVVVNYRRERGRAQDVVDRIRSAGGRALAIQADVTIESDVQRLFAESIAEAGPVRLLVNNAGILTRGRIADLSADGWDEMMTSHLRSGFLVTREFLRSGLLELPLIDDRRVAGKIVTISSGVVPAAGRSAIGQVHYLAAKSGLEGFSRGLAGELAENRITVNLVQPGVHFTDMATAITAEERAFLEEIFLLGLPRDEDVAGSVAFLLSADADHLTGECLKPNGGSA
jgi:3-oxoacyl-[acyl-carrier protein] reductase